MALVVEDGSGKTDAEAYISVADATTYLATYNPSAAWVAGSPTEQETWLKQAAQYLDLVYGERWDGERLTAEQALDHPRLGLYFKGFVVSSSVVQGNVPKANAEAARELAEGNVLIESARDTDAVVTEDTTKIDVLTFTTKYAGGTPADSTVPVFDRIEALLAPIVTSPGHIERG